MNIKELDRELISDIIQWDVVNWSKSLEIWLKQSKQIDDNGGSALEIGAREGGISVLLTKLGFETTCSDVTNPLETAKPLHIKYQVFDAIKYEGIDVLNIDTVPDGFNIVCFKSVLGALQEKDKQLKAFQQIYKILKTDGELWFAENLAGSFLHRNARKVFIPWHDIWRYMTSQEIKEMLDCCGYRDIILQNYGFFGAFGRSEMQRQYLGYLDHLLNPLIPSNSKYIVFGIARK